MNYLPILQELFESDTVIMLLIGMAVSIVAGLWFKKISCFIVGIIPSLIVYLLCEIALNLCAGFMEQILLLFIGTVALGSVLGFVVGSVIYMIRHR